MHRRGSSSGNREKCFSPVSFSLLISQIEPTGGAVLPVRAAALSFRHRIALAPDHLAAEEPARVAHRDDEAVGEGQEVPVPEPRLAGVQERLAAVPGLDVGGVGRVEAGPAGSEGAVGVVLAAPVHRRVVRVADVEPEQAVRLQLGQQRAEKRGEFSDVSAGIGFDAITLG
jgi:hypothetical protein